MVLILAAIAMVLAIAFFQVIQGLFGALIMAILTILSACVAFEFYEPLASAFAAGGFPAYGNGIALGVIFLLTLLALRVGSDLLIRGNVVTGVWIDRIAGGVVGVLTGTVIVGMLLICLQMLPFGETVLTYRPFGPTLQRQQSVPLLHPDEFTLGLVEMLSGGSLKSDRDFAAANPNLLLDAFAARNTAEKHGRVDAPADALKAVQVYTGYPLTKAKLPSNPLLPEDNQGQIYVVRVKISKDAADSDDWWRLPATHFRLVTADGRSSYPVAYLMGQKVDEKGKSAEATWEAAFAPLDSSENKTQVANLIVERPVDKDHQDLVIDWVYRMPGGDNDAPRWLVFRQAENAALDAQTFLSSIPPQKDSLARKEEKKK